MQQSPTRILVVDDEESLCEIIRFNLERDGYEVACAASAEQALTHHIEQYALLIVDVMMGELSGFGLARILKGKPSTASIPIIFCTALDSEDDTVKGLDLGADDYITKPFSPRELSARVRSILRRNSRPTIAQPSVAESQTMSYDGLSLNTARKECRVDGASTDLTPKEFELLLLLLQNRGTIISRQSIIDYVWGDEVIVTERTVDVNITRLRRKIAPYDKYITTKNGYGYGFQD